MGTLLDLTPLVTPETPAAPDPLITRALSEAARTFLQYTRAWRLDVPVTSVVGSAVYLLAIPAGSELVDIVRVDPPSGRSLIKTTTGKLADTPNWRTLTGLPGFFVMIDGASLRLFRAPSSVGTYTAVVALRPAVAGLTVGDFVLRRYGDFIAHGALARLLLMNGRSWTNKPMAQYYAALFEEEQGASRSAADDEGQMNVHRAVRYGGY